MRSIPHDMTSLFDGKTCSRCGFWKIFGDFVRSRRNLDGHTELCRSCSRAKGRAYYEQNKAAVIARTSAYQKAHPEVAKTAQKKWKALHRDEMLPKVRERSAAWREKNRDKDRAASLRWIRANPERIRERLASPEGRHQLALRNARRRERTRSVINTLTPEDWQEILARQDYTCLACRRPFTDALPPTRDHVIPVALGGALTFENTVALCQPCNSSKGTKVIDYR